MGKFDEIFDDVIVNAKAAATAVSKKATEVCDNSKQKITAAELRGEINKKLRELGALTYKAQTNDIDLSEQTNQTISEITELKENLSIVNQHIAASKNQRTCPQCGVTVPKNSLFCNLCGAKLETEEPENQQPDAADTEENKDDNFAEQAKDNTAEESAEKPEENEAENTEEI